MSLISFIEEEEQKADLASVQEDREKALRYYQPNKKLGNEVAGRSQVVMRDTFDVVESLMPSLVKVFTSGEDVLTFNPQGPEDVKAAEQETDYVNYIITQKNNGFMLFYDWIKDALLLKNGYVLVRIEDESRSKDEQYEGIDQDTLAIMTQGGGEIVQAEPISGPNGEAFYNVTVRKSEEYKCIKIDVLRPETVRVSQSNRDVSLQETAFFSYEEYYSISSLREMGLDVDDDINDDARATDVVDQVRQEEDANRWNAMDSEVAANRMVRVRNVWCLYDDDGDGVSERIHVIVCGVTELLKEDADCVPAACLTSIRLPHRHEGIALADLVTEIQDIRTALMREALNAQSLANHGRMAISDKVNLDDMLVSRVGGIVRVKGQPAGEIMPLVNPVTGNSALQTIEYMDTVRENRTGVTKYNQGIDSQSLNKTASGISQIMSASQQRVELMARLMAETGVKELFMLVHKYSLQYMRKPEVVKLRNEWVPIDPSSWKERKDMTISVGQSTGNKEQQGFQLEKMLQFMGQGMQIGIVKPKGMYNAGVKYIQSQGFKDVDSYLADPDKPENKTQPQVPPEVQKAQIQAQVDQQKAQSDAQLQQQKMAGEMTMKQKQAEQDAALEKYKADLKAQNDRYIAELQIANEREIGLMREQNAAAQSERDSQRTNQNEGAKINLQVDGMDQIKQFQNDAVAAFEQHKGEMSDQLKTALEQLTTEIRRPKKIVRDQQGRVSGTE